MSLVKRAVAGVLLGGWTWAALAGNAVAQGHTPGAASNGWVAKGQRGTAQRGPTRHSGPEQAEAGQKRIARWSPSRPNPIGTDSADKKTGQKAIRVSQRTDKPDQPQVESGDDQLPLTPLPADAAYDLPGTDALAPYGPGPACGDCAVGGGCYEGWGDCSEGCGGYCGAPYGGCALGLRRLRRSWWARDLSLFAGAHAFKGPFDQGRNGNFGLHEGVSFGAPLGGPLGWGYQVGFAAVHSNFSGDRAAGTVRTGDRDQFFVTAGIFRRALYGGIQWGVAFDHLRDNYYASADVKQLRNEIGYVLPGGHREVGYFGAYGVGDDELRLAPDQSLVSLEPTDLFAFYYRKHFEGGGDGRLWGGFTGRGDGLLGADLRVPLGRGWALENRVNYLIPRQSRGELGQPEESWGLTVQLVWHLGQPAARAHRSPFRPLLGVADNSVFMVDVLR